MNNIKIRFNTFETNSSSAHTFILRSDESWTTDDEIQEYIDSVKERFSNAKLPDDYIPTESFFHANEYGRGYSMLAEWQEKMSYLIASFQGESKEFNAIIEVLKDRIPNTKGIIVYDDSSDYEDEDEETNTPYYSDGYEDFSCFGYIDHQSFGVGRMALEAIKKDPMYSSMSLKEIFHHMIFNKKFVIIVDSDETDTFNGLYEKGFFKTAGFKYILSENYEYKNGKSTTNPSFVVIEDYLRGNDEEY